MNMNMDAVKTVLTYAIWYVSGTHRAVGSLADFIFTGLIPGLRLRQELVKNDVNSVMLGLIVFFFTSGQEAPLIQNWGLIWDLDNEPESDSAVRLPVFHLCCNLYKYGNNAQLVLIPSTPAIIGSAHHNHVVIIMPPCDTHTVG